MSTWPVLQRHLAPANFSRHLPPAYTSLKKVRITQFSTTKTLRVIMTPANDSDLAQPTAVARSSLDRSDMATSPTCSRESDIQQPPASLASGQSALQAAPASVFGLTREHIREELRCYFHPDDRILFMHRKHPQRVPPVGGVDRLRWNYKEHLAESGSKLRTCNTCHADLWLTLLGDLSLALLWVAIHFVFGFLDLWEAMARFPLTFSVYQALVIHSFIQWRVRHSPFPSFPITNHSRNGAEHNHVAAALAQKYLGPRVAESLGRRLVNLDDQACRIRHGLEATFSFLKFYWINRNRANNWGYDIKCNQEKTPVTGHSQYLAQGNLIIRLVRSPAPDFRPSPPLSQQTWFDSLYLAFQDCRRVAIATMTYAQLEYDNKLVAGASTDGWLPPIEYDVSSCKGQKDILQETDRYVFFPSDPSQCLGPY